MLFFVFFCRPEGGQGGGTPWARAEFWEVLGGFQEILGTKLVPRWALWASILVPRFAPRGPTWEGLGLDVATFFLLKSGCGWAGGVTRSVKNSTI